MFIFLKLITYLKCHYKNQYLIKILHYKNIYFSWKHVLLFSHFIAQELLINYSNLKCNFSIYLRYFSSSKTYVACLVRYRHQSMVRLDVDQMFREFLLPFVSQIGEKTLFSQQSFAWNIIFYWYRIEVLQL